MAQTSSATQEQNNASVWERLERVDVHNAPRRARYASIARALDGSLLVLFSRQSSDQEEAGLGELVLVYSEDEGRTWSDGTVVFAGEEGEPRALGTLTELSDGRLIAPFAELSDAQATCKVRLLSSDDDGQTWQVEDLTVDCPLTWWAPCGRLLEIVEDVLVMPVYGATSDEDLRATIHHCGLLRSSDGGRTWGNFSWIAQGHNPVIGAAAQRLFSFEGPVVQPLRDGRWLALVTARRLNSAGDGPTEIDEGPGAPQLLCRLWSADDGRTWTAPDQLMPGAWPGLTGVGDHTLCANALWASWGEMRLEVSRDGFASVFQELPLMTRGWTLGRTNDPCETPPPPTVPFLAQQWPFEHYGYACLLPLGDDEVVAVFGRTQRGTPSYHEFDPPELDDIPVEMEKIQAIFYRRTVPAGPRAAPLDPPSPAGRWVLTERLVVADLNGIMAQAANGALIAQVADRLCRSSDGGRTWQIIEGAQLPGDGEPIGALGVLRSGRWLVSVQVYGGLGNESEHWGKTENVGLRGGYPLQRHSGERADYSISIYRSDDEGKTWQCGDPFKGPFLWALPSVSHFIESDDGSVGLPIFGCVTAEELDSYSASNGVIRSFDQGETWGDFSFAFRTNPRGPDDFQPEPRYSEMDIAPLTDERWVAYSRNERLGAGPAGMGSTAVALSTDRGRTWIETGGSLQGVSQQKGLVLPDGGVALSYRCHSWQQPGVAITYDEGRSFSYFLTGPYETVNAFLCGEEEFVVFTCKSQRSDMCAGIYHWIATA